MLATFTTVQTAQGEYETKGERKANIKRIKGGSKILLRTFVLGYILY